MSQNIVGKRWVKLVIVIIFVNLVTSLGATEISLKLTTSDGKPMQNAIVYLLSNKQTKAASIDHIAIMDQMDKQFSPHILVVQKGTQVRFPNSDSIKHHVYSFSPALTFELQLYKGLEANPLLFSKTGVVELGCNVHDWMLGYILVVDTPYFAKTNSAGEINLTLPDDAYQLNIWHPRINQTAESLRQDIVVQGNVALMFSLSKPLMPDVNQYEVEKGDFSEY
jgi:plastocyanin